MLTENKSLKEIKNKQIKKNPRKNNGMLQTHSQGEMVGGGYASVVTSIKVHGQGEPRKHTS